MKTTNFLAIAIIAVASFTGQVVAQETSKKREKEVALQSWSLGKTLVRVVATDDGCEILCSSSSSTESSGSGMAVGKQKSNGSNTIISPEPLVIKLKEIFVTNHQINDINEEPTTFEDRSFPGASVVANKQATGKHFKEATISMKSSADGSHIKEATLSARQGSGAGAGKVNVQDLSFTVKCKGKPVAITIDDNGFTMPENCPDGTYDMVASWSWGVSNSGMSTKTVKTTIKIENGVCVDHAINTKGTGSGNN